MTLANQTSDDMSINRWLQMRQTLLASYWQLSQLPPYDTEEELTTLKHFCETLIDYTSMGHFSIYEKILPSRPGKQKNMLRACFQNIESTTDVILEFNDCYEQGQLRSQAILSEWLSKLGVALAVRMENEDKLLDHHACHAA